MTEWDNLDEYLKLVSLIAYEVESIKRANFQYKNFIDSAKENIDIMNISPSFFSEVISSFEYKVIVGFLKIFDLSGSASLPKLLNQCEQQKKKNSTLHKFILNAKQQLELINSFVEKLRPTRDMMLAHLDKKAFKEDGEEVPSIERFDLDEIDKWLDTAYNMLCKIFELENEDPPPQMPLIDDFPKLVSNIRSKQEK